MCATPPSPTTTARGSRSSRICQANVERADAIQLPFPVRTRHDRCNHVASRNEDNVHRIRLGLVISMVGDGGGPTYKKAPSRSCRDRSGGHPLPRHSRLPPSVVDFSPYGYDERQYCSPGFDLPVGLFQRSMFATTPQYHTSADNLDFIRADHLALSYRLIATTIDVIENNAVYRSTMPYCEPQLGKRGLYNAIGGDKDAVARNMAMLWVLNLSDGTNSLLDIAQRADLPFAMVHNAALLLREHGLLVVEAAEGTA